MDYLRIAEHVRPVKAAALALGLVGGARAYRRVQGGWRRRRAALV